MISVLHSLCVCVYVCMYVCIYTSIAQCHKYMQRCIHATDLSTKQNWMGGLTAIFFMKVAHTSSYGALCLFYLLLLSNSRLSGDLQAIPIGIINKVCIYDITCEQCCMYCTVGLLNIATTATLSSFGNTRGGPSLVELQVWPLLQVLPAYHMCMLYVCVCVCVCMYVCMCVCMYVCMCVYVHCMYVCTHIIIYIGR